MPTPNQSPAPEHTPDLHPEPYFYPSDSRFHFDIAPDAVVIFRDTVNYAEASRRGKAIAALPTAIEALELARHAFEEEATHSKEAGLDDDADAWVELGAAMTNALRALKPE